MTETNLILLVCAFAFVTRIPRILERWKAPLLRGPGWFFSVEVPAGFYRGEGARVLKRYRWRLFRPWALELPVLAALVLSGNQRYVIAVVALVAWLTRGNYYAARRSAEAEAAPLGIGAQTAPEVLLSLETRTLAAYTNWWIEGILAIAIVGSLASGRALLPLTLLCLYLQVGLLLLKRGFVRARTVAPVENTEQYLQWRESLRRMSTHLCDYTRLTLAAVPLLIGWQVSHPNQFGRQEQAGAAAVALVLGLIAAWYEWRERQRYLKVARETRPAKFLLQRDLPDATGLVCFRPSLPMLLLNAPSGYTINLASAPAKRAGLYLLGYIGLVSALKTFL